MSTRINFAIWEVCRYIVFWLLRLDWIINSDRFVVSESYVGKHRNVTRGHCWYPWVPLRVYDQKSEDLSNEDETLLVPSSTSLLWSVTSKEFDPHAMAIMRWQQNILNKKCGWILSRRAAFQIFTYFIQNQPLGKVVGYFTLPLDINIYFCVYCICCTTVGHA